MILRSISSIVLILDTFYVKYCSVIMQIDLKIMITFLSKKIYFYIPFYAILCDQKLQITFFREKKPKSILSNGYGSQTILSPVKGKSMNHFSKQH